MSNHYISEAGIMHNSSLSSYTLADGDSSVETGASNEIKPGISAVLAIWSFAAIIDHCPLKIGLKSPRSVDPLFTPKIMCTALVSFGYLSMVHVKNLRTAWEKNWCGFSLSSGGI